MASRVSLDGGSDKGAHLFLRAGFADRTVDPESSLVGVGAQGNRPAAADQGRGNENQRGENLNPIRTTEGQYNLLKFIGVSASYMA